MPQNSLLDKYDTEPNLDADFIKSALEITSFNLSTLDFMSLKYKKEIQFLFGTNFFPKFDLSKTIKDNVIMNNLNHLISNLKHENTHMFKKLHGYNLKGIGPGEVTLYFLIDECCLGGGNSNGLDVIVGSKEYEVKAIKVTNDKCAIDFKLGGTINLSSVMSALIDLKNGIHVDDSKTEINATTIKTLKENYPNDFFKIESEYAEIAYEEYFKKHPVIFINNSKSAKVGNIEAIKNVTLSDIMIERVTSGTIKPKIKL